MAFALLRKGKRVAVWNRSPDKAGALVSAGAFLCDSAQSALEASPATILVLLDNDAVTAVLDTVRADVLKNRTIINYTTDSKDESQALHCFINDRGGSYVKGAIVSYPRNIGNPDSYSIQAGDEEGFVRHRDLLEAIAGHALFLPLDEAYAFSIALHTYAFAAMVAFYEAVGASGHLGMGTTETARLIFQATRFFVSDALEDAVRRLETNDIAGDQARLDVHLSAFEYLAEAMRARGASIPVFESIRDVTRKAQSLGYGDHDISSIIKVFASGA